MGTKYFGAYFGAFGFTVISLANIVQNQDLFAALKRGCAALLVFWLIGMFFGVIFTKIAGETRTDND